MKKALLLILLILLILCISASALCEGGPVVVSLGDSYSSGEGIEPFYGQDAEMAVKSRDPDWLAHRSEKSWPGMLTLPGVDGPLRDHRGENWFFAAASGAETVHLMNLSEEETAAGLSAEHKKEYNRGGVSGTFMLPPQLDVFDELDRLGLKADYVTLTIGGNDIGFPRIVGLAMSGAASYLAGDTAAEKAETLWNGQYVAGGVRAKIRRALDDIAARAGSQACIILAGYPCPVNPEGGGPGAFPAESAQIMNAATLIFNRELRDIAEECRRDGMNICFVSVEEAFEGHGAYSADPYINPVMNTARDQDLKSFMLVSNYSMHPNEKGAEAYARCVREALEALEAAKTAAP